MGSVFALIRILRSKKKSIDKLASSGYDASTIFSDPKLITKLLIIRILEFIKSFFLAIIIDWGLLILIIIVAISSISMIFDFFKNSNGNTYGNFTVDISKWASSITDEELERLKALGITINPRYIKDYIEIENNSYPKDKSSKKKITTVTTTNGSSSTDTKEEDYNIDYDSVTKPYRLWWQLSMGLDSVNGDLNYKEMESIPTLSPQIKESLSPVFEWGYEDYTQDNYTTIVETTTSYTDGQVTGSSTTTTLTTEILPLPVLKSVDTCLAKYSFEVTENVEVVNTPTQEYGSPVTSPSTYTTAIVGYSKGKDGKKTPITVTHEHHTVTTKTIQTRVVEDVVASENETIDTSRLTSFLVSHGIKVDDLYPIAGMFSGEFGEVPDSDDFYDIFSRAIEYDGQITSGSGGIPIGGEPPVIDGSITEYNGSIPLFLQYDSRWGNYLYTVTGDPKQTIGATGCGTTSFAMVATGLNAISPEIDKNNDKIIDPYESAMYSIKIGCRTANSGTDWSYFSKAGGKCGLKVTGYYPSQYNEILQKLSKGIPVIASMSRGHYTSSGHFIVLAGLTSDGMIVVNDPNYTSNMASLKRRLMRNNVWNENVAKQMIDKIGNPSIIFSEGKMFWALEK